MSTKSKISICMMVKDEEKNLKRCLESLKPLLVNNLAEIIIVDTGSTDNTVNIAKNYVDNVYFHKWNNNFSEMRNITISYAKGEWIFIIDADEELINSDELISLFNDKNINKYNTVVLQIESIISNKNKKDNVANNPSPRLFKNAPGFKYVGSVHNQPLMKEPAFITNIKLMHYGYISSDKLLMEKKYSRTKELIINELKKNPKNIYYQFQFGVTYDMHGDYSNSLIEFRKAYSMLENLSEEDKKNYIYIYSSYARTAFTNKKYEEVISVCEEGIKLNNEFIDLYYVLGITHMGIGNTEKAIFIYKKYIELVNNFDNLKISKNLSISLYNIDDNSKSNIYYNLTQCYIELKNYSEANKYIDFIINDSQRIHASVTVLFNLKDYFKLKEIYEAIKKDELRREFALHLENILNSSDEEEKGKLYEVFSECSGSYGILNKIRISIESNKITFINKLLKEYDFNDLDLFYCEIFKEFINNKKILYNSLKKLSPDKLKFIVKYLIEKYEISNSIFKDIINNQIIRDTDIEGNKFIIASASVLLIYHLEEYDDIENEYYEMFLKYIKSGINYVKAIYNIEHSRLFFKEVKNAEDKFFILMNIIDDYLAKNNYMQAVKYMLEAAKDYKIMVKYLDAYREKCLNDFE